MEKHSTVYFFPNGFAREAESMYARLRHANLTPAWGVDKIDKGRTGMTIDVPDGELSCLLMMAKAFPARWGNASEVLRHAGMGPEVVRRTFEAKAAQAGSCARAELNLSPVTSEYMPSLRYLVRRPYLMSDGSLHPQRFLWDNYRTKTEAEAKLKEEA